MKNKLTAIFTLVMILNSIGQLKYPLPDAILTANQICGENICNPGDVGQIEHYTKSPISPVVKNAITAQQIAAQFLGQTISRKKRRTSKDFTYCSNNSNNPFTINDVENIKFRDGRTLDYKKTQKLDIKVDAAVEANIKQLMKLTTDLAKIDKLKAKIKASYEKVKDKELTVVGKYSEWQLSKDAREKLKKGDGFVDCRKWIETNDHVIVLSLGLVYYEITFEEKSIDDLAAEIDAELAKEGITGSISFSFKREITQHLKAASEVFEIIIIKYAGIEGKEFVETFK
jgi:hypothetical protein